MELPRTFWAFLIVSATIISCTTVVGAEMTAEGVISGECPSGLFGFGTPVDLQTGQPVYDRVAVQRSLDQY